MQHLHDIEAAAADDASWPMVEAAFAHSFKDCRSPEVWAWRYQRYQRYQRSPPHLACDQQDVDVPSSAGGSRPCSLAAFPGHLAVALYRDPARRPDTLAAFIGASMHRAWCDGAPARVLLARDHFSLPGLRGSALGRRGAMAATEAAFHAAAEAHGADWLFGVAVERWARLTVLQGKSQLSAGGQWHRCQVQAGQAGGTLCTVRRADFADPVWDQFWLQRRQRVHCSLARDSAFLAWRFDARQGRDYWCFALHTLQSDVPVGLLVLTAAAPQQSDPGAAVLVDLVLPDNPQLAVHAWGQVQSWLLAHGIVRVDTLTAVALPERRLLPYLGFAPCPPPLPVLPVVASYAAGLDVAALEARYAYTLADNDLY